MKIFTSKKGVGTSVAVDILALLAYFIFFIVVLIVISLPMGLQSKAQFNTASLETDFEMQLLNFLRTSIMLENKEIVTVAEHIANFVDACNGTDPDSINDFETTFVYNSQFGRTYGIFKYELDKSNEPLPGEVYPRFMASFVFETDAGLAQECKDLDLIRSWGILLPENAQVKENLAEVKYPTKQKNIVTAKIVGK